MQLKHQIHILKATEIPAHEQSFKRAYEALLYSNKRTSAQLKRLVSIHKHSAKNSFDKAKNPVLVYERKIKELVSKHASAHDINPSDKMVIATLNIWNINEPWLERLEAITTHIKALKPNVIAFQEIRIYNGTNQFDQLKKKLPEYPYAISTPSSKDEHIATFSKWPILKSKSQALPSTALKSDKNPRVCMATTFNVPSIGRLDVYHTHLSYNDLNQCENVAAIIDFISTYSPKDAHIVLIGDMNTYFDFPWPMHLLTRPVDAVLHTYNPCQLLLKKRKSVSYEFNRFTDAWEQFVDNAGLTNTLDGATFPNFFGSMDPTRADRIMFRSPSLVATHVHTFGSEAISYGDGKKTFPSDHLGVVATLVKKHTGGIESYFKWTIDFKKQFKKIKRPL